MKLIRFGERGKEKPGVKLPNGEIFDISSFGEDYDEDFFQSNGIERLKIWLERNISEIPIIDKDMRLDPPIKRPSKLICVGLNYAKHAEESGMSLPEEPVLFFKATSAIVGPNDDLIIPRDSIKTDWEVELGVVIGKSASYVDEEEAMDYIAGYILHNDYSEREFQLERSGQWVKGKSCDSFAPIGPYLVTKDEISDPHTLDIWLKVNGTLMQNSNTEDLVFKIPQLISYISKYMTLLPGDLISTGTPFGVGLGFDPPRFIKPGDTIELGIEGLGTSRQKARAIDIT